MSDVTQKPFWNDRRLRCRTISDVLHLKARRNTADHNELMMPILGVVRAKDFDDAVEQAVWLEHGNRHSAHIHSKNVDNITKYAKAIDTAILVKNGPSYAALGFGGEGFCTFTIASRTAKALRAPAPLQEKTLRDERQPVHTISRALAA